MRAAAAFLGLFLLSNAVQVFADCSLVAHASCHEKLETVVKKDPHACCRESAFQKTTTAGVDVFTSLKTFCSHDRNLNWKQQSKVVFYIHQYCAAFLPADHPAKVTASSHAIPAQARSDVPLYLMKRSFLI